MSDTKKETRADIWLQNKGGWLAEWMAALISEYPDSSDGTFLNGCLSTLQNKGYISGPQLEKVATIWHNCKDGWPEYREAADTAGTFPT